MTDFNLINHFQNCPVLIVGDLMLDEFIWGHVTRISPEAPVPVVEVQRRSSIVGGSANTAANVASLGGKAFVAGLVGEDAAGEKVCELLQASGIDTSAIIRENSRPTTTKTRVIAHQQQVVRIDHEQPGAIPSSVQTQLLEQLRRLLPRVKACIISDYGKGVITPAFVQEVISISKSCNVPSIVDPKGTDYEKYRGATLVKPNQLEAGKVLNRDLKTDEEVKAAGADLLKLLGSGSSLLITRGAHGMSLFEPGKEIEQIPTLAREVFDVTGAGDTVAGTIGLTLAVGGGLPSACRLASLAAAVVVGKLGTATCTAAELRTMYAQSH